MFIMSFHSFIKSVEFVFNLPFLIRLTEVYSGITVNFFRIDTWLKIILVKNTGDMGKGTTL